VRIAQNSDKHAPHDPGLDVIRDLQGLFIGLAISSISGALPKHPLLPTIRLRMHILGRYFFSH